ncbi:MAG: hypothetical protein IPH78_14005 [Bacteroidetes bacterium]|nr:hypothetical protein [Bacteroidota bacterium]
MHANHCNYSQELATRLVDSERYSRTVAPTVRRAGGWILLVQVETGIG